MFQDFIKVQEMLYLFNFQYTLKLQIIGRFYSELITVGCNLIEA